MSAYQDVIALLRLRVLTVSGIPTTAWLNTKYTPTPTTPFVSDRVLKYDTLYRETGRDAFRRTVMHYRVMLAYPINSGIAAALTMGQGIIDAVMGAVLPLSATEDVSVLSTDLGPSQIDAERLYLPITFELMFDHP